MTPNSASELATRTPLWPVLVPAALGFVAVYLLLPRARRFPAPAGLAIGLLALLLGGVLLLWGCAADPETVLFLSFSALAVVSAAMLIAQTNPVHAALSFAVVVLCICGLFLLQAAPFLMAATIIIYAGAIIVTFLFVIMLAQQSGFSDADHRSREPLFSAAAGFILLGVVLVLLTRTYDARPLDALINRAASAAGQPSARDIDAALGDEHAFFQELGREVERVRGSPDRSALETELTDAIAGWDEWRRADNAVAMRQALDRVVRTGTLVRNAYGSLEPHGTVRTRQSPFGVPPQDGEEGAGENVAPLGRLLFTDYLVPVELAGTLLLVATVGAIAITGRRGGQLR